jgi:hypothetical protein
MLRQITFDDKMMASSAVDHGFKLWSGKTKSYKIGDSKGLDSG